MDEFGSHLGFTPTYSRAPRGKRAHGSAPRKRGQNRTLVGSLTLAGMGPGLLLDGAVTTRAFEVYVAHVLAPTLRPGQVVVMDNLRPHQSDRVREAIEARGARRWFLPPYSPDLNPIEEAFSKVKTLLRRAEARTEEALAAAIWAALAAVAAQDAAGWFSHGGHLRRPRRARTRSAQPRRCSRRPTAPLSGGPAPPPRPTRSPSPTSDPRRMAHL